MFGLSVYEEVKRYTGRDTLTSAEVQYLVSNICAILLDTDKTFIFVVQSFCERCGYGKKEEQKANEGKIVKGDSKAE